MRPGRSGGVFALLSLAVLTVAPWNLLDAQAVAAGRVLRPEPADSTPISDVRVVLHRVGRETQGPLDSTRSAADGRFRFRFPADTGALYLLSARYGGVEYFSPPVRVGASPPDTSIMLVVYDTSSTAPLTLGARHVVIPRPGDDGTREVLDLIVLLNPGRVARVAPDTLGASWSGPLPEASEGLDVGESDVSPEAVVRRGDSVFLAAPIGPGEKQLSLQYHVPGSVTRAQVPLGREGGTVNVLLEEPGGSVSGPGLALADTQVIGGRAFRRWTGAVPANAMIEVRLPGAARRPIQLLGALVALAAATLAAAAWRYMGRRPARDIASAPPSTPDRMIDRIAALDARYLGREAEVPPPEWARYQEDRSRLKAELEEMLAVPRR